MEQIALHFSVLDSLFIFYLQTPEFLVHLKMIGKRRLVGLKFILSIKIQKMFYLIQPLTL